MIPRTTMEIAGQKIFVVLHPFACGAGIISWEKIKAFVPLQDYCKNMDPRFTVRGIVIQSIDLFSNRIGFMKIKADILGPDGRRVPGIAFLRGGSVIILVVLTIEDSPEEKYVVLIKQPRSPSGTLEQIELAAGMLDGSDNIAGKAIQEMGEELDIWPKQKELIDLTEIAYGQGGSKKVLGYNGGITPLLKSRGVFASPGGSDEFYRIMLYQKIITRDKLASYSDHKTGAAEENESITTMVVPLDMVWKWSPIAGTLSALYLYDKIILRK